MIRLTHSPGWVWDLTPREIDGYLVLEKVRRRAEDRAALSLHALAAQGDQKAIRKAIGPTE